MRRIALLLAGVLVAASGVMGGTLQARAEVDPYITEGTHTVNGRQWRTTCEPYSQTTRCRTEIWATQTSEVNGKFVSKNGWAFNNLTYLPSSRSLWKNNPLGYTNEWTAKDGRRWYTECDTAATGSNGCRSYAEARVIESTQINGVWTYKWVTKFVFNNIVKFGAPIPTATNVTIPDTRLRECINVSLRKPITAAIPLSVAATITDLDCSFERVHDLRGLEKFTNLESLDLGYNQISNLAPIRGLDSLRNLGLMHNGEDIDLKPLGSLAGLVTLDLSDNDISDVSPLKSMAGLEYLVLNTNKVKNLTPLGNLANLSVLQASDNELTSLGTLAGLKNLIYLDVSFNDISDAKPLSSLPSLEALTISGNRISDLTPLAGLKNLTSLDASDNEIANISALSTRTGMESLFLDGNSIVDVTPLKNMTNLETLSLAYNEVSNVAPLALLTKLTYLNLASNEIYKVAPLAALPKLEVLFLWGNPILDKASLDPLILRGCEVVFDEPEEFGGAGAVGGVTWADTLESLGLTSAF